MRNPSALTAREEERRDWSRECLGQGRVKGKEENGDKAC